MARRKVPEKIRGKEERDALVIQWEGLPKRVLRQLLSWDYFANCQVRSCSREDLLQEGMIALTICAERWKPDAPCSFSSFAFMCIRRRMIQAVLDNGLIRTPASSKKYVGKEDRTPFLFAARAPVLFSQIEKSDGPNPHARTVDAERRLSLHFANDAEKAEHNPDEFESMLAAGGLSDFDRDVMHMRFVSGLNNREIGEKVGKSAQRIQQIVSQSLAKLKRVLVELN